MTNRDTWPPYSKKEADQIRKALMTPHAPVVCPRCGKPLDMTGPVAGRASVMLLWQFRCATCERTMIARDLPEQRKSGEW